MNTGRAVTAVGRLVPLAVPGAVVGARPLLAHVPVPVLAIQLPRLASALAPANR